jgi:predicted naringenin-chalcone synthase
LSKIISIATQSGPYQVSMEGLSDYIGQAIDGNNASRKFKYLMRDGSIKMKNSIVPDFMPQCKDPLLFTAENNNPGTLERMNIFHQYGLPFALSTAQEAIKKAELEHKDITHIITTTCTGLCAPGLEIQLSELLNLDKKVKRYAVNFMGCYAAFHAMRLADHILKSDSEAKVLVICLELCSLHFRNIEEDDNLLSTYLFSDGCAALVMSNEFVKSDYSLEVLGFDSALIPEGKNDMSWNIGNNGFEMVLNKNIPLYLKDKMADVYDDFIDSQNLTREQINHYAIHPGGKNILKAFQEALEIDPFFLSASYEILSSCGNMSSATVLFVLEKIMESVKNQDTLIDKEHIYAAAFGPGLSVESGLFILSKN